MKIIDIPQDILTLLTRTERTCNWGIPEEIAHSLRPVASFDPALLPDALRPWVEDIAHRMQCPIDFVAVAATATIASIIGTACGIHPKQKDTHRNRVNPDEKS
jgi:putative DNA primase/helicase